MNEQGTRQIEYEDDRQLLTEFVFNPNLSGQGLSKEKFGHINKNLILTNLGTKEVDEIQGILDAVQILKNHGEQTFTDTEGKQPRQLTKQQAEQLYKKRKTEQAQGKRTQLNIKTKTDNRFQEVIDLLLGNVYSITSTRAGKGGQLIKLWGTNREETSQTLRKQTENEGFGQWFKKALGSN